ALDCKAEKTAQRRKPALQAFATDAAAMQCGNTLTNELGMNGGEFMHGMLGAEVTEFFQIPPVIFLRQGRKLFLAAHIGKKRSEFFSKRQCIFIHACILLL